MSANYFRRNQKVMLAILGILVMISFIVIPNMGDWLRSRADTRQDDTVVTWKFGAISDSELQSRRKWRKILNQFYQVLSESIIRNELTSTGLTHRAITLMQSLSEDEEDVVHAILLAKKGEELGLVITDAAVEKYVQGLTGNVVGSEQIQKIIADLNSGQGRITDRQLIAALRPELMARRVRQLFGMDIPPGYVPLKSDAAPAERWDYFRRLKYQVNTQILTIPVEDFISEVATPTDAQIEEFYEAHKERIADPDRPEPGFRQPRRVALEYLQTDLKEFAKAEKPKIADAEIQKYYDDHKQGFPAQMELPFDFMPVDRDRIDFLYGAPKSESDIKQPRPPEPPDEPSEGAGGPQGENPRLPPGANKDAQKASPTPNSELRTPNFPRPPEPPDEEDDWPLTLHRPRPPEPPRQPEEEFRPLEEVRESIIQDIARERLGKLLGEKQKEMTQSRVAARPSESKSPAPKFDLAKLAEPARGITHRRLKLMSLQELVDEKDLDISKQETTQDDRPLIVSVFGTTRQYLPPLFDAKLSYPLEKQFLWWVVERTDERTPPLAEIRADVVRAWKIANGSENSARSLAKRQAESRARGISASGSTLQKTYGDKQPVLSPPPFSWWTLGPPNAQGQQELERGVVAGLENLDNDFFEAVIKLQPGEATAAMDRSQSKAFVVQVIGAETSDDDLRRDFNALNYGTYAQLSNKEAGEFVQDWLAQLKAEYEVHWERPPYRERAE